VSDEQERFGADRVFAFSQFAVILDNQRGGKALGFSYQLIKGRFWRVLWRLIVGSVVFMVLYFVVLGIFSSVIVGIYSATGGSIDNMSLAIILVINTFEQLLNLALTPLMLAYMILFYLNAKATR